MIVKTGRAWLVDRIAGSSAYGAYIGVGTSSTAEALTDTTLGTEVMPAGGSTRNAATASTPSAYRRRYTMSVTTAQANGSTLTELGVFLSSSAGTMICRQVHTGISKTVAISLKYQLEIEIGT